MTRLQSGHQTRWHIGDNRRWIRDFSKVEQRGGMQGSNQQQQSCTPTLSPTCMADCATGQQLRTFLKSPNQIRLAPQVSAPPPFPITHKITLVLPFLTPYLHLYLWRNKGDLPTVSIALAILALLWLGLQGVVVQEAWFIWGQWWMHLLLNLWGTPGRTGQGGETSPSQLLLQLSKADFGSVSSPDGTGQEWFWSFPCPLVNQGQGRGSGRWRRGSRERERRCHWAQKEREGVSRMSGVLTCFGDHLPGCCSHTVVLTGDVSMPLHSGVNPGDNIICNSTIAFLSSLTIPNFDEYFTHMSIPTTLVSA